MRYLGMHLFLLFTFFILIGCGGGGVGSSVSSEVLSPTRDDNVNPAGTASSGNIVLLPASENTVPVADAKSVTVDSASSVHITLSATDADGDPLTYSLVSSPSFGTLSGVAPNLSYTPLSTYAGSDSFGYLVNDGREDSKIVQVSIVVTRALVSSVDISGKVSYDHVPSNSNHVGLDYSNITRKSARQVMVVAVDNNGNPFTSTHTDDNGDYLLTAPQNTDLKIRVYAKLLKAGTASDTASWDVRVVDNTNNDALYVMEGSLINTGTSNATRDLHADSGWGINGYTSTRVAAPFAMLDTVYASILTVLSADSEAVFPPLKLNWSINNIAAEGDPKNGEITTSHYIDKNLYILGDENADTDEYDDHVIAHEWGHYYEDVFSRSDSIGGDHGKDEHLDIRVAFGEGWGNAFSAMALHAPVYFDTFGNRQSSGFNFNMEADTNNNKGWFNESSIQRILYDLYDDQSDGSDRVSLGFTPLHHVFIGAQKQTEVFTSIFSFITYIKEENPTDKTNIESIVASEDIAKITDIYGNGRANLSDETPLYLELTVGSSVNVCPGYDYGTYNKLGNRKYVRFNIDSTGTYTVKVETSKGSRSSDPDFYLHDVSNHRLVYIGEEAEYNLESKSLNLESASYLLDVYDWENIAGTCFKVSLE